MLLLLASLAAASDGAYVVGPRDASVYLGLDAERITRLAQSSGSYADDVVDVDSGLSKLTAKGIVSYGLAPRAELEVIVPWGYNHVNRDDGPLCTALGDACKTTKGIGVVELQAKYLLLDEIDGKPLSLALGGEARFGQLTWRTRYRITNLGEGTFDLGPMLGLGRSGGLGKEGYWAASATAGWRYRFPNAEVDGEPAPGWETGGNANVLLAPKGTWSVGPVVDWFFRPNGTNIEDADPTDPDWLGGLRVQKVDAGLSANLRGRQGVVFSVSALRNVWAVNNPADAFLVGAGVQVNQLGHRREAP